MILSFFSSQGWESWGVGHRPLIPESMPVLIDDDLRFEDGPGAPRPSVAVNRWLRELPSGGAPSPKSWEYYARAVKEWMEFLAVHGVALFDARAGLKQALGKYAGHRAAGPVAERLAATTWAQHVSILSLFYRWAIGEGHAEAEPFTCRTARALSNGTGREVRVNLAVRRTPKPHVTIKDLEPDFTGLFLDGLRGLGADDGYRGRELARNAAIGELALATGLRLQEFSCLLAYEVPVLPPKPAGVPIPFRVPAGVTKGRKFRTTWVTYEALAAVHHHLGLDRAASTDGSPWRPPRSGGEPLLVTAPDARGGRINGIRRPWDSLTPGERRRLVAPGGGSCLIAVRADGGPFTAWPTVFERTADRIRRASEPRFPHVHPRRLRHTFAIRALERLVSGHYRQAARLAADTGPDAALAFYLSKAGPLMVLRDLLGHSSVLTTEKYLRRLDTTRIYREAYERAGVAGGLLGDADAEREADEEFTGAGPAGARNGPVTVFDVAAHAGASVETVRRAGLLQAAAGLFPHLDVTAAYVLLFSVYSGIVPDGIDDLTTEDIDWAGDAPVLLSYVKRRTAAESLTLPRRAVRLLEQWLDHSRLLRSFVPPPGRDQLWLGVRQRGHATVAAGPVHRNVTRRWPARNGVTDEHGQTLKLHRHRIRTTRQPMRDKNARKGSGRATTDPNHSPRVEGDHYLTATTPAQRDAVDAIIEDAQHDLARRAQPPVVIAEEQAAALAGGYPQLAASLQLGEGVLAELAGGQRDVFTAACADQLSGLHGPKGQPGPARPWICLLCPLAVFAPRHAPNLLRLQSFFARQWRQMTAAQFMAVFGPYSQRAGEILDRYDPAVLAAAARQVGDRDDELPLRPEELTT